MLHTCHPSASNAILATGSRRQAIPAFGVRGGIFRPCVEEDELA